MPDQIEFPQTDRELLIRIDERVRQLVVTISLDRAASEARASKHELDLEKLKSIELVKIRTDLDAELDKIRTDVSGLTTSRAQFYAIASTLSAVIGILIRMFWK
jgi:hypothetical protein